MSPLPPPLSTTNLMLPQSTLPPAVGKAAINVYRVINSNKATIATSTNPTHTLRFTPFSSHTQTQSLEIDLANEESKRRLFNKSKQRGFLELDLVLGKWIEENIHTLDENRIKGLVPVLDLAYSFFEKQIPVDVASIGAWHPAYVSFTVARADNGMLECHLFANFTNNDKTNVENQGLEILQRALELIAKVKLMVLLLSIANSEACTS
ncbi:hypothetical protein VNO80_16886 [Phaseolus coccineus]|uniref:Uncharacterized protein n=1 Tax=Phaseolus coccineus TaxID=3886 RepID=A0AAN9MU55_PHACN